jgi:hypothetical protein
MRATKDEKREALLAVVQLCRQGQAESESEDETEFLKNFLPTRSHFRILDPDAQLVIGDKGAGKTHVFRALTFPRARRGLAQLAQERGFSVPALDLTSWVIGFQTRGTDFPAAAVLRDFARSRESAELETLWLGLLVRALLKTGMLYEVAVPSSVRGTLVSANMGDLNSLFRGTNKDQGRLCDALDALDRGLQRQERFVFVSYDELDRVSPGDWDTLATVLRGLVQFWASYGRRWRRLRPKIFLRRDLYRRAALFGPDIAKIAAHRAELLWSVPEFYGVFFKRALNSSNLHLQAMLEDLRERYSRHDEFFLYLPRLESERPLEVAVERLFGKYMGPDPKKGLVFRWIPNHVKDGHGRIYPRPLLRLFEESAQIEEQSAPVASPLIRHTSLRGALDKVSVFRVDELVHEEFPWLRRVQISFQREPFQVPAERREVLRLLQIQWPDDGDRPPSTAPDDLLDYLVELGIAQLRQDGRFDVGDLYLRGLHLKRKGGVAQPKPV